MTPKLSIYIIIHVHVYISVNLLQYLFAEHTIFVVCSVVVRVDFTKHWPRCFWAWLPTCELGQVVDKFIVNGLIKFATSQWTLVTSLWKLVWTWQQSVKVSVSGESWQKARRVVFQKSLDLLDFQSKTRSKTDSFCRFSLKCFFWHGFQWRKSAANFMFDW